MSGDGLVNVVSEALWQRWSDPVRGDLAFQTLSGEGSTTSLTTGIADLARGGWLGVHRHEPPEVYHVLEGRGVVELDGQQWPVAPGSTVHIGGNVAHGIWNTGHTPLRIFYTLAVDRFADVVYQFDAAR